MDDKYKDGHLTYLLDKKIDRLKYIGVKMNIKINFDVWIDA